MIKKLLKRGFPNIISYYRKLVFKLKTIMPKKLSNGKYIFYGKQNEGYESNVLNLLKFYSKEYNSFINFGCNAGYFVVKLESNFQNIIGVEALLRNYNLLIKNILINKLTNKVICLHTAVSDKIDIMSFYGSSTGGSLIKGWNNQKNLNNSVQSITGDMIFKLSKKNDSALFLIDCEAAEYFVLKGLENTIRETNSTFVVEIPCREFMPKEIFNPYFKDIFEFMFKFKYSAKLLNEDGSLTFIDSKSVDNFIEENRYKGMMVVFATKK